MARAGRRFNIPINPAIQQWMDDEGVCTLKELAVKHRLPYASLRGWAIGRSLPTQYHLIALAAKARGCTPEQFLEALQQGIRIA